MHANLFTRLDDEWATLKHGRSAGSTLRRWADQDVVFERFVDLDGVIAFVRDASHPGESNDVLAGLLALVPGDRLAARTFLQAVLFGLVNIAARYRSGCEDEEIDSVVIAAAYDRIHTYPLQRRPRRIALNFMLDIRQVVTRTLRRRRVCEVLTGDAWDLVGDRPVMDEEQTATAELVGLVEQALRTGQLRECDARLILRSRVAHVPIEVLAAERG
jgi:hypothetical protein